MNIPLAVLLLAGVATLATATPIGNKDLERGLEALIQLADDEDHYWPERV